MNINNENKITPGDLVKYSSILIEGIILDSSIFLERDISESASFIGSKIGYIIKYANKDFPLLYVGPVARREFPNTENIFCGENKVYFHKFLYDEEVLWLGVPFKTSYRRIYPNGGKSLTMERTIKHLEQIFYTVSPSPIYNHKSFPNREFK